MWSTPTFDHRTVTEAAVPDTCSACTTDNIAVALSTDTPTLHGRSSTQLKIGGTVPATNRQAIQQHQLCMPTPLRAREQTCNDCICALGRTWCEYPAITCTCRHAKGLGSKLYHAHATRIGLILTISKSDCQAYGAALTQVQQRQSHNRFGA